MLSCVALLAPAAAPAQTVTLRQALGEWLAEYQLPVLLTRTFPDLDRTITGHAIENAPDLFVIAYYVVGTDPDGPADSLHVAAFERATGSWERAAVPREAKGSVVAIRHTARHILIDTHVNPSAGVLVVLSRALEPVAELDGWLLRVMSAGVVLYHRSQVHFAATHPVELWTWNEETGRHALLYPTPPHGAVRRRYIETTRALYARLGERWFREHNHHMDPERFGSRLLDTLITNQAATDVAFVIRFGEGDGSPSDPPPLDVVVTCRGVTGRRADCAETALADVQTRHPGWSTVQLLNDLLGNPLHPGMTTARGAEMMFRLTGSRARFRVRPSDPWRYGMLSVTRVPFGCYSVMLFGPNLRLRSQVWLDSVATLEVSETLRQPRGFADWTDSTRVGETWMRVPADAIEAAVARCRNSR
jgi:hypothetical protein